MSQVIRLQELIKRIGFDDSVYLNGEPYYLKSTSFYNKHVVEDNNPLVHIDLVTAYRPKLRVAYGTVTLEELTYHVTII